MIRTQELIATGTCRWECYNGPATAGDPTDTVGRSTIELTIRGRPIDATFRIRPAARHWWSRTPTVLGAHAVRPLPLPPTDVAELAADALALWRWRQDFWLEAA